MSFFPDLQSAIPQQPLNSNAPSFNLPDSWLGRTLQPIKNHPILSTIAVLTGLVAIGIIYIIHTCKSNASTGDDPDLMQKPKKLPKIDKTEINKAELPSQPTQSQEKTINQTELLLSENTSNKDLWTALCDETRATVQLKNIQSANFNSCYYSVGNISCPKETAIKISEDLDLHGNRMGEGVSKRSFIAFQVPVWAKDHFWQAIFQSEDKNPVIFDLTGGNMQYCPTKLNETIKYDSFSVTFTEQNVNIYTYQVTNETGNTKEIKRFNYDKWPDGRAIAREDLESLVKDVETLCPNPENLPWIHCKAGVGRTGTLITAIILKEKIESGDIRKNNLEASLIDIIIKLRKQRDRQFVQTGEQFILLREYANHLLLK